jgi:hypothetical protein
VRLRKQAVYQIVAKSLAQLASLLKIPSEGSRPIFTPWRKVAITIGM